MESTKTISKRLLAIMLSLAMVFSLVGANVFSASAKTSGDYKYKVLKDGTVKITGYTGSAKEITIPSKINEKTVTCIGDSAFDRCGSLTSVKIPDSVKKIGAYVFSESGLTSIVIPNSVESIDKCAFENCYSLKSINVDEKNANYSSLNGVLFNKNKTTLVKYPAGKTDSSYTIPNSVKSIGYCAFYGCKSLTSVTIGNDVESIRNSAFLDTGLYSDKKSWKNGVLYIGNYLIAAKEDISGKIKIEEGTKVIGDWAFAVCDSLTSVVIPNSVKSIGECAFDSSGLTNIVIPNSVTSIGGGAFNGCTSLKSVVIPGSVESIGDYTFYECTSLKSVTIGNSVKSIGDRAFEWCCSLKSIKIPKSITKIGSYAFSTCRSLKKIEIPSSVKSIGKGAFKACQSLESAKIAGGIKTISADMFYGCKELKSVTIPKSVTRIEKSAFKGCKALKKITYNGKFSGLKKITVGDTSDKFIKMPIYYVSKKTIKKHTHTTKVKNKKAATYFKKGYSGDRVCKNCGMILNIGETTYKKTPGDKIKVTKVKNQIKINYTKVSGATGFQVQVCKDADRYLTKTYNTKKSVTKTIPIKNLKKGENTICVYLYKKSGGKTVYSGESYFDIKVK